MRWLSVMVGILMASVAMQDLFHTLFHPSQHGDVSEYLCLKLWRFFRRFLPQKLMMAGPLNFLVVILYWGLSVILGFALIYLPFLPSQFVLSPGMDPSRFHGFWSAFNVSLSSLITVTLGAQTNSGWLQFAMSIEAVLGFAILTASISWILSIYPVIEHRRSLAHEITLLHFVEQKGIRRLDQMSDSDLNQLLLGLATQVIEVRVQLSQFPITYFFQERDERSALGPSLYYLAQVAYELSQHHEAVSTTATVLGGAIDDLVALIARKYLHKKEENRWTALRAFIEDHKRTPLERPRQPRAA